jgi:hypothetical protein
MKTIYHLNGAIQCHGGEQEGGWILIIIIGVG